MDRLVAGESIPAKVRSRMWRYAVSLSESHEPAAAVRMADNNASLQGYPSRSPWLRISLAQDPPD